MKITQLPVFAICITMLVSGLAGCASDEIPEASPISPTATTLPTEKPRTEDPQPTAIPNPSPSPGVFPPQQAERILYQINAILDYYQHQVSVEMEIEIPHPTQDVLKEITLVVPPNAWPGAFSLQEISSASGDPLKDYRLEGVSLTVPLTEDWLPGEVKKIQLSYLLNLPIQNAREGFGPSPFGYTDLQTNLVDWYPMVPPFDQQSGWVIHDPWIFGEYLVYPAADFQVSLAVSNGPEVVVAASAKETVDANVRSYELEQARNFVFSISPDYQLFEQQVGDTLVRGYAFGPYQIPGKAAFDTTVEALTLYQSLYGPYQQSALSMVQADFNHGMEYEGLFFLSRAMFDSYNGSYENYLVTIAAHETAHQWWYGIVANDQALEPWLDESLCTYSELVYFENLHPEAVEWWWAARINYYQPEGLIDGSIYDYSSFQDQYLAYRNATYLRGALFMNQLRTAIGEDQFFSFLRAYNERYKNQIATGNDFFLVLEEYVSLDSITWLGEYFQQ